MTAGHVDLEDDDPPPSTPWDARWLVPDADWCRVAPPARRWLFRDSRRDGSPGVFPLGKAGRINAAGGVGKTMALVALTRAVASGTSWFDTFACDEPGPVLLLLGEEDAEEAHRRLYNDAHKSAAPSHGSIVVVPLAGLTCAMLEQDGLGNPIETSFTGWLRGQVAKRDDWRLIIIDPQSRFAGLDAEKDNAIATRFVQVCESFLAPRRSVLVSHHTPQTARGKGAMEEPRGRGVTAAFDGFRWEAGLASERVELEDIDDKERLGEIVTLSFAKSNYSRKADPLLLRRDDHGGLHPLDATDVTFVEQAKSGAGQRVAVLRGRAAARAAIKREEMMADDACAHRILTDDPTIKYADLKAAVCKARACGSTRAVQAISRTRKAHESQSPSPLQPLRDSGLTSPKSPGKSRTRRDSGLTGQKAES